MAALGELLIFLIYLLLGACFIWFLISAIVTSKHSKPLKINRVLISGLLLSAFILSQRNKYEDEQIDQVGKYYLTKYPNCKSCYIELSEDMIYRIIEDGEVVETGDWHHESGGDYWITYLNGKRDQLGNGFYSYSKSELKHLN